MQVQLHDVKLRSGAPSLRQDYLDPCLLGCNKFRRTHWTNSDTISWESAWCGQGIRVLPARRCNCPYKAVIHWPPTHCFGGPKCPAFFARSDATWLLLVSAGNLKDCAFKNNVHTEYKHEEIKCAASAGCRQELQTLFSIPGSPGVKNIWNLKDIAGTCCKTWWITSLSTDFWRWFYERIPPSAIRPRSINTRLNNG